MVGVCCEWEGVAERRGGAFGGGLILSGTDRPSAAGWMMLKMIVCCGVGCQVSPYVRPHSRKHLAHHTLNSSRTQDLRRPTDHQRSQLRLLSCLPGALPISAEGQRGVVSWGCERQGIGDDEGFGRGHHRSDRRSTMARFRNVCAPS
jgi:hypothetical protein